MCMINELHHLKVVQDASLSESKQLIVRLDYIDVVDFISDLVIYVKQLIFVFCFFITSSLSFVIRRGYLLMLYFYLLLFPLLRGRCWLSVIFCQNLLALHQIIEISLVCGYPLKVPRNSSLPFELLLREDHGLL